MERKDDKVRTRLPRSRFLLPLGTSSSAITPCDAKETSSSSSLLSEQGSLFRLPGSLTGLRGGTGVEVDPRGVCTCSLAARTRRPSETDTVVTQDLFKFWRGVEACGLRLTRNFGKHCRFAGFGLSAAIRVSEAWCR